jgi:molecular chaperone GrpE (heat shock protein)
MNEVPDWKIPKWPFFLAYAVLLGFAWFFILRGPQSLHHWELAAVCVIIGAVASLVPFYLEYQAAGKLIELHAVGEVSGKIEDLKKFTEQVSAATDQWARVHETTKGSAEKTAAAAYQISERITSEVRDFTEFQKKMNDAEKGALRLEVEKLRRIEGDWLQVVVRILDHIYSLHTAAARSGQPELAGQISHFQNACRDAARRVGLAPFTAEANEAFDAERHRAHGVETAPEDGVVAETLAPGVTFQGRLIRPALVRLQTENAPAAAVENETQAPEPTETVEAKETPSDELPL